MSFRPLIAGLIVLLLAGQLAAAQHLHVDEAPSTTCEQCLHGDNVPVSSVLKAAPEPVASGAVVPRKLHKTPIKRPSAHFQVRAPPAF